jgi:methylmalonyl-CoA mutase
MYSVATVLQHGQPDFHVEPILQWRAAEIWEELRARSDRHPSRPLAFFANLGAVPSHKARSTWTQNLLAAAGIDAATNDGFGDTEALAEAWKDSSAALAVICGSDEDYEALLEPAIAALKQAGCPVVLVAGRPGEREPALREAGVSDFVFVGADVLTLMTQVLDSVGVQR